VANIDANEPLVIVSRIQQILGEGNFVATYKYAVLLAMVDLCSGRVDPDGNAPASVTTLELAERVAELYWPQSRLFDGGDGSTRVLRQNSSVGDEATSNSILGLIIQFRAGCEVHGRGLAGDTLPWVKARAIGGASFAKLLRRIERILITMPLPKLQRVGRYDTGWLYAISWNDTDNEPSGPTLSAYLRGQPSTFDNLIRFKPGVAETLRHMAPILRAWIADEWTQKVEALNRRKGNVGLRDFLFGTDREVLTPLAPKLLELQRGECFYCQRPLRRGDGHVDHFLPRSRYPDDALANLVLAHSVCNLAKSDYLAAMPHVDRWRLRCEDRATLQALAHEHQWEAGVDRAVERTAAVYGALPQGYRLWLAGREFDEWHGGR
jgi:5-methylcytosine-specific restriction endonuclease McrA